MTDRPDPSDARDLEAGANPGYAFGQLAKVLRTAHDHPDAETRRRADRKASDWLRVVGGMLSGALRVGSRTPVRGVPVWATARVVAGGFATGDLEAGGPLLPHEEERLATFPVEARPRGRAALNASFLTDDGLEELSAVLEAGTYRVDVPEEGALLAVAWLARNGGGAAARRVLDEVGPWSDRLRFYPAPADGRPNDGRVRLVDVGAVVRRLERKTVPDEIERQTEAYAVWLPHQDRVVGVLAETVTGPMPTLAAHPGGSVPPGSLRTGIEGGWPFQTFPNGWRERAEAVLEEYAALRAEHPRLRKPDRPGDNPVRLRSALEVAVRDPSALTGLEVGRVRAALAQIDAKRGLPGSDRLAALRAEQARVAALPTLPDWARALAGRLGAYDPAGGLPEADVDSLLSPVGPAERPVGLGPCRSDVACS